GGHLGDQPHGIRRPVEQEAVAAAVEQAVQAIATLDGVGPVRRRDLGADLQRPDEPAMSGAVSGDGLEQPAGQHRSSSTARSQALTSERGTSDSLSSSANASIAVSVMASMPRSLNPSHMVALPSASSPSHRSIRSTRVSSTIARLAANPTTPDRTATAAQAAATHGQRRRRSW